MEKIKKIYRELCKNIIISIIIHSFLVSKGVTFYKKMNRKYGENIIVGPVGGTGDTYLSLMYIDAYLDENQISDYYYLCCNSNSNIELVSLFQERKAVFSNKAAMVCLTSWAYPFLKKETLVISSSVRMSPMYRISLAPNKTWLMNATETFSLLGYNLKNEVKLRKPVFDNETGIKLKKQSIVLVPYANAIVNIEKDWWRKLTKKLLLSGYSVYTNTNSDSEVIEGTSKLHFSYREAKAVLEQAVGVIALRSGFCEIISSIQCMKIILYTTMDGMDITSFFSLNEAGLDTNAIEINANLYSRQELLNKVFNAVERGVSE